jgi:hypothetical protein
MVKREKSHDPANTDWLWVKYLPGGSLEKDPNGVAMAGRVAGGIGRVCTARHASAKSHDYFFTNDSYFLTTGFL